ncbi:type II secretion system protein GspG [Haloferula sp.]|uniref:type II secretion system protein GspG n=1 Tax=Haloferula sp. TaxID=2497595 RepID=UPI00329F445D
MLARVITLWDYVLPGLAIIGIAIVVSLLLGVAFSESRQYFIRRWFKLFIASLLIGAFASYWHHSRVEGFSERYRRSQLFRDIRDIELAAEIYYYETGSWPEGNNREVIEILSNRESFGESLLSLGGIQLSDSGAAIDPWGSELHFATSKEEGFEVISMGPDRVIGTRDDLSQK